MAGAGVDCFSIGPMETLEKGTPDGLSSGVRNIVQRPPLRCQKLTGCDDHNYQLVNSFGWTETTKNQPMFYRTVNQKDGFDHLKLDLGVHLLCRYLNGCPSSVPKYLMDLT